MSEEDIPLVRWKLIVEIIAIGWIIFLLMIGTCIMIQLGPGEIYYYDLNGRTHPDIHYHTIYPVWVNLWFQLSLLSLPALFVLYFIPKKEVVGKIDE